jgi:hypothetical protein
MKLLTIVCMLALGIALPLLFIQAIELQGSLDAHVVHIHRLAGLLP